MRPTKKLDNADLRRYLLGAATPEQRSSVETALLDPDDPAFEDLLLVEDELIDACAAGELREEEKRRFESYLAKLPDRRSELRVTTALSSRPSVTTAIAAAYSDRALIAAAVLLVSLSAGWRLWSNLSDGTTPPIDGSASVSEPETAGGLVVTLSASRLRSDGRTETLTRGDADVTGELRLDLPEDVAVSYRGIVHDASGGEVLDLGSEAAQETAEAIFVGFTLHLSQLSDGDYYVELRSTEPGLELEVLHRYDFRVTSR